MCGLWQMLFLVGAGGAHLLTCGSFFFNMLLVSGRESRKRAREQERKRDRERERERHCADVIASLQAGSSPSRSLCDTAAEKPDESEDFACRMSCETWK